MVSAPTHFEYSEYSGHPENSKYAEHSAGVLLLKLENEADSILLRFCLLFGSFPFFGFFGFGLLVLFENMWGQHIEDKNTNMC